MNATTTKTMEGKTRHGKLTREEAIEFVGVAASVPYAFWLWDVEIPDGVVLPKAFEVTTLRKDGYYYQKGYLVSTWSGGAMPLSEKMKR